MGELGYEATHFGSPAYVIFHDFVGQEQRVVQPGIGSIWHVGADLGGVRYQVKVLMIRGTNTVAELWIMTLRDGDFDHETVLHLQSDAAADFVALIRGKTFEALHASLAPTPTLVPDAETLAAAYRDDAESFRALIAEDVKAVDVVAVAHRRAVVNEFKLLLEDDEYFNSALGKQGARSTEGVWQDFFELNPWLLGLGLSTQLFTGWDPDRLEQVVSGYSIAGPGKRTDALLQTAGAIRMLVFTEIKHHRTSLIGREYRSGCFLPSDEIVGAVAQLQGTVQLAQEHMGAVLRGIDGEGASQPELDAFTYRPRSFVVAGRLSEFVGQAGGVHQGKIRSFELYRRNLREPEVITFDELLARAEMIVGGFEKERG